MKRGGRGKLAVAEKNALVSSAAGLAHHLRFPDVLKATSSVTLIRFPGAGSIIVSLSYSMSEPYRTHGEQVQTHLMTIRSPGTLCQLQWCCE
jgi:hypothetical protein